jgi:hypothetical protein
MKTTIQMLGCFLPRHSVFHCVLFALAFSHFISSPTARAVMNDYVDYALISKSGLELNKKNAAADAPCWKPCLLPPEQSVPTLCADCRCYAVGRSCVVPALNESIITEHLLL